MFLQEYQVGHHLQMKNKVHLTSSLVEARKKIKIKTLKIPLIVICMPEVSPPILDVPDILQN